MLTNNELIEKMESYYLDAHNPIQVPGRLVVTSASLCWVLSTIGRKASLKHEDFLRLNLPKILDNINPILRTYNYELGVPRFNKSGKECFLLIPVIPIHIDWGSWVLESNNLS